MKVLLPVLRGVKYVSGKQCCCEIRGSSDTEKHDPKFPIYDIK